MNMLVRYEAAKQAIAEYKTVDEVKDFRDKALAIEAYAKQANDLDLERDAAIARVRAERKCGELLSEMEKAKGGGDRKSEKYHPSQDATGDPSGNKTLAEMGVTKDQSSKWQQLARVPDKEFEEAINLPGTIPSANHLLKRDKKKEPRMNPQALWLWGRLVDMESNGLFDKSLSFHLSEMTDAMRNDSEATISKLRRWINE